MNDVFKYIDIKPIVLNIETNNPQLSSFTFQAQDLSISDDITISSKSNTPFFTSDIEYPLDILKKMEIKERLKFLFDLNTFKEVLYKNEKKWTDIIETKKNQKKTNSKTEDEVKKKLINEKQNINIMLSILFPTSFPIQNNIVFSFEEYIQKKTITPLIENDHYSYIKNNTILRTTWLNDFINHPEFRDFQSTIYRYKEWYIDNIINNQKYKQFLIKTTDEIKTDISQITEANSEIFIDNINQSILDGVKTIPEKKNYMVRRFESEKRTIETITKDITQNNDYEKIELIKNKIKDFTSLHDNYLEFIKIIKTNKGFIETKTMNKVNTFLEKIQEIKENFIELFINIEAKKYLLDIHNENEYSYKNKNKNKNKRNTENELYSIHKNIEEKYEADKTYKKLKTKLKMYSKINNPIIQGQIEKLKELSDNNNLQENQMNNIINGDEYYIGVSNYKTKNNAENEDENNDEKSFYEIYLYMDVLEGKINDKNKSNIECAYRNKDLINRYYANIYMVNDYSIKNVKYPFIKLDNLNKEIDKKTQELEKKDKTKKRKKGKNIQRNTNKKR